MFVFITFTFSIFCISLNTHNLIHLEKYHYCTILFNKEFNLANTFQKSSA